MPSRKNFPSARKARQQGALVRLRRSETLILGAEPSPVRDKRIARVRQEIQNLATKGIL